MMRVSAFNQVGGFDSQVIAGEEPELCFRLRRSGNTIWCLDAPMTQHDADMSSFWQWWKRAERSGHAYAHGVYLHGLKSPEYYCLRDSIRIWLWAVFVPLVIVAGFLWVGKFSLLLFIVYPIQVIKIMHSTKLHIGDTAKSMWYAVFIMIAKWPQALGQLRFINKLYRGHQFELVEYK